MKYLKKYIREISIENKISIIGHVLTVISLVLVFFTLLEMQIQRNRAYMPQIAAESQGEIIMDWKSKSDFLYLNDKESESQVYDDITLDIYNIGAGAAKNIQFEWDDSNIKNIIKNINNNSNNFVINFNDNKMLSIKFTDIEIGILGTEKKTKLNFLAAQNDIAYKIKVPREYLLSLKLILIDQKYNIFPSLKLNVYYEDIQGKRYEQKLFINTYIDYLISSSENDGFNGTSKIRLLIN